MSTLESAIVFTLILVMLSVMIAGPEAIILDSYGCAKDGGNELFFMEQDKDVLDKNYVHGSVCYDASPEKLCTYLTGLSDNFRIIYGAFTELTEEEKNEEEG